MCVILVLYPGLTIPLLGKSTCLWIKYVVFFVSVCNFVGIEMLHKSANNIIYCLCLAMNNDLLQNEQL